MQNGPNRGASAPAVDRAGVWTVVFYRPETSASHFRKEVKRGSSKISDRTALQERQTAQGVDRALARGRVVADGTIGRGVADPARAVADLPTRRDLRQAGLTSPPVNRGPQARSIIGSARSRAAMEGAGAATFKRTTRAVSNGVAGERAADVEDIPLLDIAQAAIQQWVADRFRQRVAGIGSEWVGGAPSISNRRSIGISCERAGSEVPQNSLKTKPHDARDLLKLLGSE